MFLKLNVFQYADNTLVSAHSECYMVLIMSCFQNYCNLWNLNTNFDKTKVLIFGDRITRNRQRFIPMCGHNVEVVDTLKFLGVTFSKNCLFTPLRVIMSNKPAKLFVAYTEI